MYTFKIFDAQHKPSESEKNHIVDFLYTHLGDYGDAKNDILKCLNYAIGDSENNFSGFALLIKDQEETLGITIINQTGMSDYIPENILVYIAVHHKTRGKGIGKQLMEKAIATCKGDIALHVEPNNPAKHLYEKLGFTNKYLEMRYKK